MGDWDFTNNGGPRYTIFRADRLQSMGGRAGSTAKKIKSVDFTDCDFSGVFETRLIFVDCTFKRCDFGLSTFHRAKFTRCKFVECSFTQVAFKNCELRDCFFEAINFAGNETELDGTLITNPGGFIFGGRAAVGHLPPERNQYVQMMRFEETRSTISRAVLSNLRNEGSEDDFYSAVKASTICAERFRFAQGVLLTLGEQSAQDSRPC